MEIVESVDDLKSSRSMKGTYGPDFELLDARIASALNKIIQNTRFKKKVSLEEVKAQKLKTVLDLYTMEIHQKKSELDYHRLKTMVKTSIEHIFRMKNFEARNGNF